MLEDKQTCALLLHRSSAICFQDECLQGIARRAQEFKDNGIWRSCPSLRLANVGNQSLHYLASHDDGCGGVSLGLAFWWPLWWWHHWHRCCIIGGDWTVSKSKSRQVLWRWNKRHACAFLSFPLETKQLRFMLNCWTCLQCLPKAVARGFISHQFSAAAEALRQLAYLYGLPALDADAARQSHVSTCVW